MAKKQKKQEALSVSRLINEVLVAQLSIPFRQIVNDTTFSKYTGSKRPDILISEFEYDVSNKKRKSWTHKIFALWKIYNQRSRIHSFCERGCTLCC